MMGSVMKTADRARRQWIVHNLVVIMLLSFVPLKTAPGATIVLKDGTFVEGKIVAGTSSRSVRLESRFGTRTFNRKDIEQIIETDEGADSAEKKSFDELPPALRAVLNAQADYRLKRYDRALARLEPFKTYIENSAVRIQIDWLFIELYERLGRWEQARKLLEEKKSKGSARERIRAQAHLDILGTNSTYDLRFIGDRAARNFLRTEQLQQRAREANSLADVEIMQAALEEYCEQLLVQDKLSVKGFSDQLKPDETYEALKRAPASGELGDHLPYVDALKTAEASLNKAQSILGEYGRAFELDLLRTEVDHLIAVASRMLNEMFESSPETFVPASDPQTGRLTGDGRQQWQARCDDFINKSKPALRLLDYMIVKAERYPRDLNALHQWLTDLRERIEQAVRAAKKERDKTHV